MQKIIIKQSNKIKGRGVFAEQAIKKGELIEITPLLLMPMAEFEYIKKTRLYYYFFEYSNSHFAIALGYGSLYNHSYNPNARYYYNYSKELEIYAIKDIQKGEEILFNYNWDPNDKTPLGDWFKE